MLEVLSMVKYVRVEDAEKSKLFQSTPREQLKTTQGKL